MRDALDALDALSSIFEQRFAESAAGNLNLISRDSSDRAEKLIISGTIRGTVKKRRRSNGRKFDTQNL